MNDEELNAVTVGQIRKRLHGNLDRQIAQLASLVRKGPIELGKAKTYLEEDIKKTLEQIQTIYDWAGIELLFPES